MKLLTLTQVAQMLGISDRTARKISADLPGAVVLGKRTRYQESAAVAFVQAGGGPLLDPAVATVNVASFNVSGFRGFFHSQKVSSGGKKHHAISPSLFRAIERSVSRLYQLLRVSRQSCGRTDPKAAGHRYRAYRRDNRLLRNGAPHLLGPLGRFFETAPRQ